MKFNLLKNVFGVSIMFALTLSFTLMCYGSSYYEDDLEVWGIQDMSILVEKSTSKTSDYKEITSYSGSRSFTITALSTQVVTIKVTSEDPRLEVKVNNNTGLVELTARNLAPGEQVKLNVTARARLHNPFDETFVVSMVDGTDKYPIQVTSAEDLQAITEMGLNKSYIQTQDINLNSYVNWTPIGTKDKPFTGKYDGNGNKITNMNISTIDSGYYGLFGQVKGSAATLKNINLTGNITINTGDTGIFLGGIVGHIESGKIEKCSFEGNITSKVSNSYIGGIAGYMLRATASNVNYTGVLSAESNNSSVGGVTAYNDGTINIAKINGVLKTIAKNSHSGGAAAINEGTIRSANVSATMAGIGEKNTSGGIAGENKKTVQNSAYSGIIEVRGAEAYVGSIAGKNSGDITSCAATGTVSLNGDNGFSGGIAGNNIVGKITRCQSSADVKVTGRFNYAGGIAGRNYTYIDEETEKSTEAINSTISNCIASGAVLLTGSGGYAGGITGQNMAYSIIGTRYKSAYAIIENCIAANKEITAESAGRITADSGYGGVFTNTSNASIAKDVMTNNYAYSDMLLNDTSFSGQTDGTGIQGAGKTMEELELMKPQILSAF